MSAATPSPDDLLKEHEAALLLRISVRTLQAWRTKRTGAPYVRVGRTIRYRRRDLITWIESQTVSAAE